MKYKGPPGTSTGVAIRLEAQLEALRRVRGRHRQMDGSKFKLFLPLFQPQGPVHAGPLAPLFYGPAGGALHRPSSGPATHPALAPPPTATRPAPPMPGSVEAARQAFEKAAEAKLAAENAVQQKRTSKRKQPAFSRKS